MNVDAKGNIMTLKINNVFERLLDDKKLDLEELSWADYVCINLDLILYQNEGLLNKAFALLIRFHSQRKSLLDLLRSVQMLESDQAIDTLRNIELTLTNLRRMAQNSEFWLGQTDRESIKTSQKTIGIFDYLSGLLTQSESDEDMFENDELTIMKHAAENPFLAVEEGKNSDSHGNTPISTNVSSRLPHLTYYSVTGQMKQTCRNRLLWIVRVQIQSIKECLEILKHMKL